MAIRKIPEDTKNFHYQNANPKDIRTGDCVTRALSFALGQSWEKTMAELFIVALDVKSMLNNPDCYVEYLKRKGYTKHGQPKHRDGTKYTVAEFIQKIADKDHNYILSLRHHMVCVKEKQAWDIWNSTGECVGVYWEVPADVGNQWEKKPNNRLKFK